MSLLAPAMRCGQRPPLDTEKGTCMRRAEKGLGGVWGKHQSKDGGAWESDEGTAGRYVRPLPLCSSHYSGAARLAWCC